MCFYLLHVLIIFNRKEITKKRAHITNLKATLENAKEERCRELAVKRAEALLQRTFNAEMAAMEEEYVFLTHLFPITHYIFSQSHKAFY